MVEIAKALARSPKVLILDEATSALTAADVARVFAMLKRLRARASPSSTSRIACTKSPSSPTIARSIRNGRYVATFAAGTKTDDAIVEMMIGREYKNVFPPLPAEKSTAEARCSRCATCRGPAGSTTSASTCGRARWSASAASTARGKGSFSSALFGTLIGASGSIEIDGKPVKITNPKKAKSPDVGMALIPEDRKNEGVMLPMSVRDNLSFAALGRFTRYGIVNTAAEAAAIDEMIRVIQIKSDGVDGPVAALSGGNQQKVVIAKWLMTKPRIILLNDPTRGIDVGTKQELYQLLRRLAENGAAIIFYSTDYDELIGCCDRVLVLYDGRVVRTLAGRDLNERNLVASALNLPTAGVAAAPALAGAAS